MRKSFMFCSSANRTVHTPPCNSHSFYQSIRDFIGSISVVETTVSLQSSIHNHQSSIGRVALFLAFILLPMVGWGATYKLIDGSTINSGALDNDFFTGVSSLSNVNCTISGTTYTNAIVFSGTGAPGVANTDRYIKYDVKTTKTQIKVYAYNKNTSSSRSVNIGAFIEGNESGEEVSSTSITKKSGQVIDKSFTNTTNTSIYITVPSSASDVYICQVEVIETGSYLTKGATPGYSLNANKGRVAVKSGSKTIIDGIEIVPNGDYTAASSTVLKLKTATTHYICFKTNQACNLDVTASTTDKKFYINTTKGGNTGTEYKATVTGVALDANTIYYINPAGSEVQITKLEFKASAGPTDPTITFSNSDYEIGTQLDLSTLFESNSTGAVTYSIKNANGTGATLAADGKTFTATTAGTATVTASQAEEAGKYNAKSVDATITVKAAATKWAITYANTKGASTAGLPTEYSEGIGIASFAALEDVTGFHFTGWSPASISSSATGEQTITAQWEKTARDMFTLEMKTGFTTLSLPKNGGEQALNSTYATVTGGSALAKNIDASNDGKIQLHASDGIYYSGNNAYVYVDLTEPLHEGDTIIFTSKNDKQIGFTIAPTRDAIVYTSDYKYTIPAESPLIGESDLYIWRNSNSTYIKTITIKTHADYQPVVKYTVTFDKNGASSADIPSQTVKSGKKATKPADPEKTGELFVGWVVASTEAAYDFNTPVTADVSLKAKWQTPCTVTYKDGETTMGTELVAKGSTPTASSINTTKDVATFVGWFESSTLEGDPINLSAYTVSTDKTLYGKWNYLYTSGKYTFTGHLTMGTSPNSMTIENNSNGKGYNAGRIDNIFVSAMTIGYEASGDYGGWKLKTNEGSLKFRVEKTAQVSVTLKKDNSLKVKYVKNGTNEESTVSKQTTGSVTVDAGSLVEIVTTTSSTTTLSEIAIIPLYTATFNNGGHGTTPATQTNVASVTLSPLSEDGYVFLGWQADKIVKDGDTQISVGTTFAQTEKTVNLTDNTTFTVQWTLPKSAITYTNTKESTPVSGELPNEYTEGVGIESFPALNNVTGYTFKAWDPASIGTDATGAKTIDAQWTANTYAITYNLNDGEWDGDAGPDHHTYDVELILPTNVVKSGFSFYGWFDNSSCEGTAITSIAAQDTEVKEYWAKWGATLVESAINYADTKGSDMTGYPTKYSETIGIASFTPLPDQENYKFVAWSPTSIGAEATGAQTITATWKNKHNVSYDANGGSGSMDSQKGVHGEEFTLPACAFTAPDDKVFDAWTSTDVTITDNKFTMPDKEVTIKATWKEKPFPYATSIDMEQFVLDNTKSGNYGAYLTANNWTYSTVNGLDSLNSSKANNNYPYLGLKFKTNPGYVEGIVRGGKLLVVKNGNLGSATYIVVNDEETGTQLTSATGTTPNVKYFYSDNATKYKFNSTNAGTNILKAMLVVEPYVVSFANGGSISPMQFKAVPLILPDASGAGIFDGWYDAAEGGNRIGFAGDSYTPSGDVTLYAQFAPLAKEARLNGITMSAGTLTPEFNRDVFEYSVTVPYTVTKPQITGVTKITSGETYEITQAANWDENATVVVKSQDQSETKTYTVAIHRGPKDGVCIIHVDLVSEDKATVDASKSFIGGTATASGGVKPQDEGGCKFNTEGAKLVMQLSKGNFTDKDVIKINITKAQNKHILAYSDESGTNLIADGGENMTTGINTAALIAGSEKLWFVRTSGNSWNPTVSYVEVYRPMNPVLTAIKITDYAGVEHAGKIEGNKITFNEDFHFMTDLKNLNIAYTIASNDNSKVTKTIANQWQSGEANTLTLTDKDGDITEYTITVNVTPSEVVRTGLTAGKIVTYCNSKNVIAHDGAKFYYISGKATDLSSIELTEVTGELVAGYPYIVEAEKKEIRVVYGDEVNETAQVYNGLHGVLGATVTLEDGDYIIKNNKYYRAHTGNNNTATDGRAFLRLSEIESVSIAPGESTSAPSPRRIILGTDEVNISTGFNTVGETELGEPRKFIIHNQVVIIRNGQLYNAQGALIR